jgi:hypothetical protein
MRLGQGDVRVRAARVLDDDEQIIEKQAIA